jgi:hypothetical protein
MENTQIWQKIKMVQVVLKVSCFVVGCRLASSKKEEISQEDLFAWADWSPEETIEEYRFKLVAAAAIANMERYYE